MLREMALLLTTSLFFAMGFAWLGQPYLLGYIATGVFLGPLLKSLGDSSLIHAFGHLGMLMLLFTIGIEFDLVKFRKIWKKSVIIVLLQLILSAVCALILQAVFELSLEYSVLIAFLLTLSSTAVVVKLLEQMGEFGSANGSLIISILIVQDLAIVPMMLILRSFGSQFEMRHLLLELTVSVSFLVGLIVYLGKKSNRLLNPLKSIFNGNQETMTLASATFCFGFSALASVLGLSSAYGAFLAGLIIGSFGNKKEVLQFALPISSMLIMMFFISIGLQIDPDYILHNWFMLLIVVGALILAKIFMNYLILRSLRFSAKKSIFVSTMLSQASEFSFTFVAILVNSTLLDSDHRNMMNAVVVISLTFGSILPIVAKSWYQLYRKNK